MSGGFAGIAASPGGESIFTADESFFVSRFWLGDGGGLSLGRRTQIGPYPKAIVVRDSRSGRHPKRGEPTRRSRDVRLLLAGD